MNKLILKTLRQISYTKQQINPFAIISKNFSKKNTKPSAGSDVEVDKTKKTVRGSSSDVENNNQTPKKTTTESKNSSPAVKIIETIPGHKAPFSEDTVAGRYTQTLFTVASQNKELYSVYEDMSYINNCYEQSENFRIFADNSGLNHSQITNFFQGLSDAGSFCKSTKALVDLLARNKRFMFINQIAKKYKRFYITLSKEEKIKIISAHELDNNQKERVKEALHTNPENAGKTFVIDYEVNQSILGGLQMYSENRFMDLSLNSRVDRLKEEVNKLI